MKNCRYMWLKPYTNPQDSLKIKITFCLEFQGEDRCRIDKSIISHINIFFEFYVRGVGDPNQKTSKILYFLKHVELHLKHK